MKHTKITLLIAVLASLLNSCSNLEGYDGAQMKKALQTMSDMNYNTRVYQATDGRYYPHR